MHHTEALCGQQSSVIDVLCHNIVIIDCPECRVFLDLELESGNVIQDTNDPRLCFLNGPPSKRSDEMACRTREKIAKELGEFLDRFKLQL